MARTGETIDALHAEIAQLRQRNAELEQELQTTAQSAHLSHILIEAIPVPVFYKDIAGVYRGCNQAFAAMLGHPAEHIIGKTVDEISPGDLARRYHEADLELIRQETTQTYETEVAHADGTRHQVLFHKAVFRALDGHPAGMIGIMIDVSDRKRAEEEVIRLNAELKERADERTAELQVFKTLVDNAPDGIMATNNDGIASYANAAYRTMFGYGDDIIGKHITDFYSPEEIPRLPVLLQEIAERGATQGELQFMRSDGSTFPGGYSVFAIRDDQGQPTGAVAIIRNLENRYKEEAERAALQQQVINAQREALRELSTPLIPIADEVVIMPLIGTIDSWRAQQAMETLLEGVAQQQARLAIVDITGVSVVDTQVAQSLVSTAQAVRLLGARVMLTGIQPQIAQTLVQLGVDLSEIITRSSLQRGIGEAFQQAHR
jgi:PAS domain S-box-containing protein